MLRGWNFWLICATLERGWDMGIHADDPAKGWLLSALCIVTLVVFAVQCAPVLRSTTPCAGVQVLSNELTPTEAEAYCRYGVQERQKVEAFWGATWSEPIRIHVSSVYATGNYEQGYGKSLRTLEQEWRVSLREN